MSTMSNGTRDQGNAGRSADEAALSARLRHLGERLDHVAPARSTETRPASGPTADPSAFARGFRLSSELVAGVLVGAGIGWLLDRWLGTLPWGMFVFALLGFTAGVVNVIRSAGAGGTGGTSREDRQAP
jgi:ATP synthase protein I